MLNIDRLSEFQMPPLNGDDSLIHTFQIDLSTAIKIEKRVVKSLLSLFGEIGGLKG